VKHYLYTETWAGLRKTPCRVLLDEGRKLKVRLEKDGPLPLGSRTIEAICVTGSRHMIEFTPQRQRAKAGDVVRVPRDAVVLEND
jgi:hypothetical protein